MGEFTQILYSQLKEGRPSLINYSPKAFPSPFLCPELIPECILEVTILLLQASRELVEVVSLHLEIKKYTYKAPNKDSGLIPKTNGTNKSTTSAIQVGRLLYRADIDIALLFDKSLFSAELAKLTPK